MGNKGKGREKLGVHAVLQNDGQVAVNARFRFPWRYAVVAIIVASIFLVLFAEPPKGVEVMLKVIGLIADLVTIMSV